MFSIYNLSNCSASTNKKMASSSTTPISTVSKPVTSKKLTTSTSKPSPLPILPSVPKSSSTDLKTSRGRTSSSSFSRRYPYFPATKKESDVDKSIRYQDLLKNVPREVLVDWMLPRLPLETTSDRLFIDQDPHSNLQLLSLILSRLKMEQQTPHLYTSLVNLAQYYDMLQGIELLLDGLTNIEIKILLSKLGVSGTAKKIASMDYASLIKFIADYSNNEGGSDLKPLFAAAATKRKTTLTNKSNPSTHWDEPSRVMKPVCHPNATSAIDPLHRALTYEEETAMVTRLMREIASTASLGCPIGTSESINSTTGKTYTEDEKKRGVHLVNQMVGTVVKNKKSALVKTNPETPEEVARLLNQPENFKPTRRIPRKRPVARISIASSQSLPISPSIPSSPSSSVPFLPFNPHSQPSYPFPSPSLSQPPSSSMPPLPPPWFGNSLPLPPPPSSTIFRDRKKLKI